MNYRINNILNIGEELKLAKNEGSISPNSEREIDITFMPNACRKYNKDIQIDIFDLEKNHLSTLTQKIEAEGVDVDVEMIFPETRNDENLKTLKVKNSAGVSGSICGASISLGSIRVGEQVKIFFKLINHGKVDVEYNINLGVEFKHIFPATPKNGILLQGKTQIVWIKFLTRKEMFLDGKVIGKCEIYEANMTEIRSDRKLKSFAERSQISSIPIRATLSSISTNENLTNDKEFCKTISKV